MKNRRRNVLLLLTMLLALSLSRGSRTLTPPVHGGRIDVERTGARNDLDAFIEETMEENDIPGLAALVIKNDQVIFDKGYGQADIKSGVKATPDTTFLISSCSKTLGAVSLMQLYDQGKFGLDDDINQYLKNVPLSARNPDFLQTPITFRQLLTHTSGLSKEVPSSFKPETPGDPTVTLAQLFSSYFTPGGQNFAPSSFLPYAPGKQYEYSNSGSALWAYMAEVIDGEPFYQFSKENLIDKLGMTNTSWRLSDLDPSTLATLYKLDARDDYVAVPAYSFVDYPSGSIRTSVNQLEKFLQMFMDGGQYNGVQILKATTVAEMQRRQNSDRNNTQALAWMYDSVNGDVVLGHEGANTGSGCYMFFRPSDKSGVIVLWNSDESEEDDEGNGPEPGKDIGSRLFQLASATPTPATGQSFGTAAGTLTLTSSQNPSAPGQPVTFTASLICASPPTGTMSFSDGGAPLATFPMRGPSAGFTTAGLAPGSHNIAATYSGDSNCASAVSPLLVQTVSGGTSPGRAGATAPIPTPCSAPNARAGCVPLPIGGSGAGPVAAPGR